MAGWALAAIVVAGLIFGFVTLVWWGIGSLLVWGLSEFDLVEFSAWKGFAAGMAMMALRWVFVSANVKN